MMIKQELMKQRIMKKVKDNYRKEVQDILENYFDLNLYKVTEYSYLPGGVILEDSKGNKMYIYYDINRKKVVCK